MKTPEQLKGAIRNIANETYAARLSFDEVVDNAVAVGKYLENIAEKN